MANKPTSKIAIADYYNDYSSSYEQERRAGYYSLINDLEFEKIKPFAIGVKTLEIGCGTGLILERTAKVASKAIGVDISEGMLGVCRKKGLNIQQASATSLPFRDGCFDLVYAFKALPHVPDIRNAIVEIVRVTKPGGRMILEFYNPLSFKGLNYKIASLMRRGEPVYIRHDRLGKLKRLFPEDVKLISRRGVRIFAPCACFYTIPGISVFFKSLDRYFCDSFISMFAGYYIVEAVFAANHE
jgi:ubiquinone/menaquinone biosynthesis C-methylase UbiE